MAYAASAATSISAPPYQRESVYGARQREYRKAALDPDGIEVEIGALILDDEVEKKSGIYPYVLTRDEKHLNIRAFTAGMKHRAYERQAGLCAICGEQFDLHDMEADHIRPWSEGGPTSDDNCQMLCKPCNREKAAN